MSTATPNPLVTPSNDNALTCANRARITDISRLDWHSTLSQCDSTPLSASTIRHDEGTSSDPLARARGSITSLWTRDDRPVLVLQRFEVPRG